MTHGRPQTPTPRTLAVARTTPTFGLIFVQVDVNAAAQTLLALSRALTVFTGTWHFWVQIVLLLCHERTVALERGDCNHLLSCHRRRFWEVPNCDVSTLIATNSIWVD